MLAFSFYWVDNTLKFICVRCLRADGRRPSDDIFAAKLRSKKEYRSFSGGTHLELETDSKTSSRNCTDNFSLIEKQMEV